VYSSSDYSNLSKTIVKTLRELRDVEPGSAHAKAKHVLIQMLSRLTSVDSNRESIWQSGGLEVLAHLLVSGHTPSYQLKAAISIRNLLLHEKCRVAFIKTATHVVVMDTLKAFLTRPPKETQRSLLTHPLVQVIFQSLINILENSRNHVSQKDLATLNNLLNFDEDHEKSTLLIHLRTLLYS